MQRLLQLARHEERHGSENASEEAFHVAGATAIELAVTRGKRERVARPSLAFDRDAVAMAGKPDAALAAAGPMVANRLAFAPSSEGIRVEATPWLSR